jgi:beta-glucosidase
MHVLGEDLISALGSATNRRSLPLKSSLHVLRSERARGDWIMTKRTAGLGLLAASSIVIAVAAQAQPSRGRPWLDSRLSPDQRAAAAVRHMTTDEKLRLVLGYFGTDQDSKKYEAPPEARYGSAGFVPGIPRLGIPPQWQTDAGVGVATQGASSTKRDRTSLPSGMATAATWNPDLAFQGGRMIGAEARASGFNVMLAGGVDLVRDPRNGRNFEYGGEDPLLAGTIVGSEIAGIQSNHIISTTKHYALNDLETGRDYHDARIDPAAARMSDLLAFQFAIERGDPGSVMCSYNRVNGDFACENRWLLTDVLRGAFGFTGYVMSDWGAVHSTEKAALAGLDQESGWPFDDAPYFGAPLKAAIAAGRVPRARLDEMATRILRPMFAHGLVDDPVPASAPIDYVANAAVTQADAEQGIVLLKNEGNILPLGGNVHTIVVMGSHADKGVLAGSGSSLVYPRGGNAVPGIAPTGWPGPVLYDPSSPVQALKALRPNDQISFVDGSDPAAAAAAAKAADIVIVFAHQWTGESFDAPLQLADGQDGLIEAVIASNPRTAVVLETGGPVLMPWAARVPAIVEAWYPGTAGGKAIANVLTGAVNPSGHLPVTFPLTESQLPRPVRPGTGLADKQMFSIDYSEGAAVGYKWFDAHNLQPLFPFGFGLSYTRFDYGPATATANPDGTVSVQFAVRNAGQRPGKDVAQVYVSPATRGWEAPKRLGGFQKVDLAPGAAQTVSVTIDPRLLATFDNASQQWRIAPGSYRVLIGESSRDIRQTVAVNLPGLTLPSNWRPARAPQAAAPARSSGERGR